MNLTIEIGVTSQEFRITKKFKTNLRRNFTQLGVRFYSPLNSSKKFLKYLSTGVKLKRLFSFNSFTLARRCSILTLA